MKPVDLRQVQAIEGAKGAPGRPVSASMRLRAVPLGGTRPRYGPTVRRVGPGYRGLCGTPVEVVAPVPRPCPVPEPEPVETVAQGVAEGLRRAPLISSQAPPWEHPGFRGVRFPQSAIIALNTFGNANVRTAQVQRAVAGYLGTTAFAVTAVNATVGTPAAALSFLAPDNYVGDELVISCQDVQVAYSIQWTVTVSGQIVAGPFAVIGGRAPLNVQARRDEVVAVNAILRTGDVFVVPLEILVNGWTYPSTRSTDGTYDKVLREGPKERR